MEYCNHVQQSSQHHFAVSAVNFDGSTEPSLSVMSMSLQKIPIFFSNLPGQ
jgi:hypothetical protein